MGGGRCRLRMRQCRKHLTAALIDNLSKSPHLTDRAPSISSSMKLPFQSDGMTKCLR
jgi:hypothetical protein